MEVPHEVLQALLWEPFRAACTEGSWWERNRYEMDSHCSADPWAVIPPDILSSIVHTLFLSDWAVRPWKIRLMHNS